MPVRFYLLFVLSAAGSLGLLAACSLDSPAGEDGGTVCGNGVIDPGEECDPKKLEGGQLVAGPVYRIKKCHKGTLSCNPDCTVPAGACQQYCGDEEVNGDEQCDGKEFAFACVKGTLTCNADCTADRSKCEAWCGDSVITFPEQCEPTLPLPANACYNGTVICKADCTFDLSKCNEFCGDEVMNGAEKCDGPDFPYQPPCHDASGAVSCTPQCELNTGTCTAYCGDGKLNGPEDCDGTAFKAKPCATAKCQLDCRVDDTSC